MASFRMSKWYLDCISASGDVSIGYAAEVRWGGLDLHYASLLDGSGEVRYSLRPRQLPTLDSTRLLWHSESLSVTGEWQADSLPVRCTVFQSDQGSVDWHCLMPRAQARLNGIDGLGYAERLTMTIAPWKLPLRTLRWGRFVSASDWIVWIDWAGDFNRRIVYWNGREVPILAIEDSEIVFDGGSRLALDRSVTLREGSLGATALSAIPRLRRTLPIRLLQVTECKWRSRALLTQPGCEPVAAWAIHERVDWPDSC